MALGNHFTSAKWDPGDSYRSCGKCLRTKKGCIWFLLLLPYVLLTFFLKWRLSTASVQRFYLLSIWTLPSLWQLRHFFNTLFVLKVKEGPHSDILTLCIIFGGMPGFKPEILRPQPGVLPMSYTHPTFPISQSHPAESARILAAITLPQLLFTSATQERNPPKDKGFFLKQSAIPQEAC